MAKAQKKLTPFKHPAVAAVFEQYPERVRTKLLVLRELVFETAASIAAVGEIEETLRWGEPAYLTTESGSGSMIRINRLDPRKGGYAMYFHCQTNLVAKFRELHPDAFAFEGNRAILFHETDAVPLAELRECISLALTYRSGKKSRLGKRLLER
jgi:Domain of unknown function (DU1801)